MILAASQASAAVINLDPPGNQDLGNVYSQDGYTFTNSDSAPDAFLNSATFAGGIYNADTTGPDLIATYYASTNTLTKTGGGAFNFFGLSVAADLNNGLGGDVAFTFNHAYGTSTSQTVSLAARYGLQALKFNETNLISVVFTTTDATASQLPELQFDFAVVDNVSAVPLPSSLPLFGGALLAFGGLGFGLRRRGLRADTRAA